MFGTQRVCTVFLCAALSRETYTMKHSEILYKLYLMASMELSLHMVRQAPVKHTLCKVPVGLFCEMFLKTTFRLTLFLRISNTLLLVHVAVNS